VSHPADAALAGLIGRRLHRLVRYEDGPLGLVLVNEGVGDQPGFTYFQAIAAGWRLWAGDELIDGSYHETEANRITYADRLQGQTIDSITVAPTADAWLTAGDLRLQVWSAAGAEPAMMWFRPGRETVIIGPGERWSHSVLDPEDPLHEVATTAINLATHT
jgi:hypothetical protein